MSAWWKVTAVYHRVYDWITRGLTAKKPGSAPNQTFVIEYGTTLLLLFCGQTDRHTDGQDRKQHPTSPLRSENGLTPSIGLSARMLRASASAVVYRVVLPLKSKKGAIASLHRALVGRQCHHGGPVVVGKTPLHGTRQSLMFSNYVTLSGHLTLRTEQRDIIIHSVKNQRNSWR